MTSLVSHPISRGGVLVSFTLDAVRFKRCPACSEVKQIEHFTFIQTRGHYHSKCKTCCALDQKNRRAVVAARKVEKKWRK